MKNSPADQYSKKETQVRFEAALRGARIVGPHPLKNIPKKNGESRAANTKASRKTNKTKRS